MTEPDKPTTTTVIALSNDRAELIMKKAVFTHARREALTLAKEWERAGFKVTTVEEF